MERFVIDFIVVLIVEPVEVKNIIKQHEVAISIIESNSKINKP